MFRNFIGPSPNLYVIKNYHPNLFFYGVDTSDTYLSDQEFFKVITDEDSKLTRLTNQEVTEMFSNRAKKFTKDQRLIKSVREEAKPTQKLSDIATTVQIVPQEAANAPNWASETFTGF